MSFSVRNSYEAAFGTPQISYGDVANYVISCNSCCDGGGTGGTTVATYEFGAEGLQMYLPGSGIRFDEGIYLDLTATASVTITFT